MKKIWKNRKGVIAPIMVVIALAIIGILVLGGLYWMSTTEGEEDYTTDAGRIFVEGDEYRLVISGLEDSYVKGDTFSLKFYLQTLDMDVDKDESVTGKSIVYKITRRDGTVTHASGSFPSEYFVTHPTYTAGVAIAWLETYELTVSTDVDGGLEITRQIPVGQVTDT